MSNTSEYHKYLFLGKITDSLSASETEELEKLFAESQDAKNEYEFFLASLPETDVASSFKRVRQPAFWKKHLPAEIQRQQKQTKYRIVLGASLVVVFVAGFMLLTVNSPQKSTLPVVVNKSASTIQLKLANGRIIDLNKDTGDISEENINLVNHNGSLTYETKGANGGMNSISVPTGMTYHINLSDGSEVWMNSETSVSFPSNFDTQRREITLSGEAYLKIAKNKSRPFYVRLPLSTVEVTGTEFNVNTYDTLVSKVSLVEGLVNLVVANGTIKLTPGMQGVYNDSTDRLFQESFNAKKVLGWREGLFYFEKASLPQISKVIRRWYGIQTVIEKTELNNKVFAGILNKNEPIEVFLDDLKNITRIETYFDKEGVLHFR